MISRSTRTRHASVSSFDRVLELAPRLLARALGGEGGYADLFFEQTSVHRLVLRRSRGPGRARPELQPPGYGRVEGVGIRVLRDGVTGFSATDRVSGRALFEAAEAASPGPRTGGEAPVSLSADPLPAPPPLPPDAPDGISESEKETLLLDAWDAAAGWDERVRDVEVVYQDRVRRVLIANTDGFVGADATNLIGLRIGVTVEVDGRRHTAHAVHGGACGFNHFLLHPPERLARDVVERALRRAAAAPFAGGEMPVVLAGGWGGAWLHETIGHLLEADVYLAAPCGRPGDRIAPEIVSLADDAALPGARATGRFDDEGTPCGRTVLIEEGRLRGVLTDRLHAERLGLPRTGNGRRHDFRFPPLPRMTNLVLAPGPANPADLVAEVRRGLYVREIGGGRFDPESGRFALEVLDADRIVEGRLDAPVAGVRLVGRAPEVLHAIAGIAGDGLTETGRGVCEKAGQVVPVSATQPTVLLARACVETGPGAGGAGP